jgi:hypothetical protein
MQILIQNVCSRSSVPYTSYTVYRQVYIHGRIKTAAKITRRNVPDNRWRRHLRASECPPVKRQTDEKFLNLNTHKVDKQDRKRKRVQ